MATDLQDLHQQMLDSIEIEPEQVEDKYAARNYYSKTERIKSGTKIPIIRFVAVAYCLQGFRVLGNGDGYFCLYMNGIPRYSGRITTSHPVDTLVLPCPEVVADGTVVDLSIINQSGVTISFEASIFGEVKLQAESGAKDVYSG